MRRLSGFLNYINGYVVKASDYIDFSSKEYRPGNETARETGPQVASSDAPPSAAAQECKLFICQLPADVTDPGTQALPGQGQHQGRHQSLQRACVLPQKWVKRVISNPWTKMMRKERQAQWMLSRQFCGGGRTR